MLDRLIIEFDKALRTLWASAPTVRSMPGESLPEADMSDAERRHAAALMRINHCGEICAQALYQGQALTSRNPSTRQTMERAAFEETEHLNWTERRIGELGGRKSLLNPLWYAGSLGVGVAAGLLGDDWNLGFLAETERQVERHLDVHLASLPPQDRRSWEVLEQMKVDEIKHAETAVRFGARELPLPVKFAMKLSSKVMTTTAYYV
ncbi:demethoxyubiquinone hydroxylase family protein [Denitratisoma sp. DHT3]|uniref:2-polyprenyl-3-methyl-6-methoxy-1,4-benzoquinone monooxygenase n=1 Tax=Denitratisoma sp. DHT3 TaxID=1981880 RepID=UPI0011983840|nr:2-polyprenyl-3-methyl-6-methoxy-1,4-benzoquinone monooxygenase [Denitratisoma sp. DHT3]QDX82245.1 demethoxyubiquinone hydroxylase family protein [Denitratisoma sp. DHT3]